MQKQKKAYSPDNIKGYFHREWFPILIVTVTGLIYNVGLIAEPWFEGQLAQILCDIIGGKSEKSKMFVFAGLYVAVICFVQLARYFKRFYVRRFANNVSKNMKNVLYKNLVHKGKEEIAREEIGSLMTKAISDVDACAEGMRKFTTEIFDTGIALLSYLLMLLLYDWRLTLISCIFPPFAYVIANRLKKPVSKRVAEFKESAGRLSGETLDRVSGALTYRVLGAEQERDDAYDKHLKDYEQKAVRAGVLETAMPPVYQVISLISVIFILVIGAKNVNGTGFTNFNIAAFTTFLACFLKLATKSSKAAKLFNAVQKARVSWKRIKPLMKQTPEDKPVVPSEKIYLSVEKLCFSYPGGEELLHNICFTAEPSMMIGITGPVACGKSTLGKAFLCETPYRGSIKVNHKELSELPEEQRRGVVAYQSHDPELFYDTIKNNILLSDTGNLSELLSIVRLDKEVSEMPNGEDTVIGSGGVRLSGGQQARVALARTVCYKKPLMILDDPFSALDRKTEQEIYEKLRIATKESIVLLISHRLYLFPKLDRVIYLSEGKAEVGTHETLMKTCAGYRERYLLLAGEEAQR